MALSRSRVGFPSLALLSVLSGCGGGEVQSLDEGSTIIRPNESASSGGTGSGGMGSGGTGGIVNDLPMPSAGGTVVGGGSGGARYEPGEAILIHPVPGEVPGFIGFAFGTRNRWGVNGPAFTFSDDAGSTIEASIPDPTKVCISGTAEAVDLNCGGDCWATYWGAGWGLNLNQAFRPATPEDPNEPQAFDFPSHGYSSFSFEITGSNIPNTLRVIARPVDNDGVARPENDEIYCAQLQPGYNRVDPEDLRRNCWEGPVNEPIDQSKIWTLQFHVATMPYPISYDFCVENLSLRYEPLLR